MLAATKLPAIRVCVSFGLLGAAWPMSAGCDVAGASVLVTELLRCRPAVRRCAMGAGEEATEEEEGAEEAAGGAAAAAAFN